MSAENVCPGAQDDEWRWRSVVSSCTTTPFLKTVQRDSPVTGVDERNVTVLSIVRSGRKAV
jgi:hypothetical protein